MSWTSLDLVKDSAERAPEELRQAAECLSLGKDIADNTKSNIYEMFRKETEEGEFDVFLSHASKDAYVALGVWQLLTDDEKFRVYVDWIHDPTLNRKNVNKKTADEVKARMRSSRCLIYIVSSQHYESKWMPWELGYFDGFNGNIGILPVLEDPDYEFKGQEYLGLYEPLKLKDIEGLLEKSKQILDIDKFLEKAAKSPKLATPAIGEQFYNTIVELGKDPRIFFPESTEFFKRMRNAISKYTRNLTDKS